MLSTDSMYFVYVLRTWEFECFQHNSVQYNFKADCGSNRNWVGECAEVVSEGQLLHEEVDSGVHLKAVKVVGVSLQPHEKASIRHIGREPCGSLC